MYLIYLTYKDSHLSTSCFVWNRSDGIFIPPDLRDRFYLSEEVENHLRELFDGLLPFNLLYPLRYVCDYKLNIFLNFMQQSNSPIDPL
jgi:hypothetical protein